MRRARTIVASCALALTSVWAASTPDGSPLWTSKVVGAGGLSQVGGTASLTPIGDGASVFDRFVVRVSLRSPMPIDTDSIELSAALPLEWLPVGEASWTVVSPGDPGADTAWHVAEAELLVEPLRSGELPIGVEIQLPLGNVAFREGSVDIAAVADEPPAESDEEPSPSRGAFAAELPIAWGVIAGIVAGAVLLTGALAVLLVFAVRHGGGGRRLPSAPVDTRPPSIIALQALDELIARGHIERNEYAQFFDGASSILRGFIERAVGVRAPRLTTDEFLREARRSARFTHAQTGEISGFLNTADALKFAKGVGTPALADEAVGTIRRFVSDVDSTRRSTPEPLEYNNEGSAP